MTIPFLSATTHLEEKRNRHGNVVTGTLKSPLQLWPKPYKSKYNSLVLQPANPPMVDHFGAWPKNVKFRLRQ